MTLRTKKDRGQGEEGVRKTQKVPLPNNSMFVMGLKTNAKWLHSIRHDNRPFLTKSAEEQYMNGERISLTFRRIGTFLSKDGTKIWGQGARGKTKGEAQDVLVGAEQEVESLIERFGRENHQSDFDWEKAYGEGSNVLHFDVTSNETKV
jgi:2OG-Fe(II) oxygenase superfamily